MTDATQHSSGPDVVVVGQVARDLVLVVEALPDAGGSTSVSRRQEILGGKGANQAVAAAQLGLPVGLVGVVGRDGAGDSVLAQAELDGIDVSGVVRREGASALLVDVVEAGPPGAAGTPTRRLLEDVPQAALLTAEDVEASAAALTGARAVLVQLQQPSAAVHAALRLARHGGALLVVDGAPEDERVRDAVLGAATVLRADAHEGELLAGRALDSPEAVAEAAADLVAAGPRVVVLDAGAAGNVVAWPGGRALVPLVDVDVADPTGGGDTFVTALAVALLRGEDPEEATRWASAAAALTVTRWGGRPDLSRAAVDELAGRARTG